MERRAKERRQSRLATEKGTVIKEWGGKLSVALVYPNTYYVGMSNLGLQSIYGWINSHPNMLCERVFLPDNADGHGGPGPRSVESGSPLSRFDVIAFTIPFELDYPALPVLLRSSGLPIYSSERTGEHPLIIGGGAALSANPEPVSLFLDAVAIGEAEPLLPPLFDLLLSADFSRRVELLESLAGIQGVYVPRLYDTQSGASGRLIPVPKGEASPRVHRQVSRNIDDFDTTSVIVAKDTEFSESFLMEIARGCGHGCNFCLAGHTFRPVRERSVPRLLSAAARGLQMTHKVGLVGSAVSDYRDLENLVAGLQEKGARISVSSLRVQSLTEYFLHALVETGNRTVTIAPEAGNERMRTVINKRLTEPEIMAGVEMAARHQVPELKLYYMVGLPTESRQDVQDIVDLSLRIQETFRTGHRSGRVRVGVSGFVPKAHTPFEFAPMEMVDELAYRLSFIRKKLAPAGIAVSEESARWAQVQGILARGDRRLAAAMAGMRKSSLGEWSRAMKDEGLAAEDYLGSADQDERSPWDVIDAGPSKKALWRLWQRALAGGGASDACPGSAIQRSPLL